MDRIEYFIKDRVEPYVVKHPIRTTIGFFLFLGSLETVVPMIADPISHALGRVCEAIFF